MPLIAPGRIAPAFSLSDQHGRTHAIKDYRGRQVVLFFYPKDLTSACTEQACAFRDLLPSFDAGRVAVLGVSILNARSKRKFAEAEGIGYPLLADDRLNAEGKPDPLVSRRYGVWGEKTMYGRKYMGIVRTTYLVGADGRVARRWDAVKVPGHADEVLSAAAAL